MSTYYKKASLVLVAIILIVALMIFLYIQKARFLPSQKPVNKVFTSNYPIQTGETIPSNGDYATVKKIDKGSITISYKDSQKTYPLDQNVILVSFQVEKFATYSAQVSRPASFSEIETNSKVILILDSKNEKVKQISLYK